MDKMERGYILAQSKEDIMNVIAVHANMFKLYNRRRKG